MHIKKVMLSEQFAQTNLHNSDDFVLVNKWDGNSFIC